MQVPLSITLKIDQPCTENWDGMQEAEAARFCAHCQKPVMDFTGFTDTELLAFFSAHTGSLCGRIRQNHQRVNSTPEQPVAYRPRAIGPLAATLLSLSALTTHAGRPAASHFATPTTQRAGQPATTGAAPDTIVISGTIKDIASRPLAAAQVKCGTTVLQTDDNGYFEWRMPAREAKPLVLQFCYGNLPRQVRNYHPAMGNVRFDIVLDESTAWCAPAMGMIVVDRHPIPDSLSVLRIDKLGKLDRRTKTFLEQLAQAMRYAPGVPLRLVSISRHDPARAQKQVEAIINYMVEQQGISSDRFQAETPVQQKNSKWELQVEFVSIPVDR